MQRPIRPDWLLRQAKELVGQGPGQPRNSNLRRAASSAYYALFHHIALASAEHLMPLCTAEDRWSAARHLPHKGVKKVCDWVNATNQLPDAVQHSMSIVRKNLALRDVASTFVDMYQVRHDADYNHFASFNKAATITNIESVQDAMTKLTAAKGTPDGHRFLAYLAMQYSTG